MTDERERFEAMLDADPAAWHVRLVYADWLEERGEQDAADGQRWQATHRKTAFCYAGVYLWWLPEDYDANKGAADCLDRRLFGSLAASRFFPGLAVSSSRRNADAALASVLARLAAQGVRTTP